MKFICTLIVVEDIKRSRDFYENILGQKVIADFGENVTFEGDFAIHQKEHFQSLINNNSVSIKSNSFELYFEENNLNEIQAKIKSSGIEFIHEVIEQPWKQMTMRFYDPDGNLIEIGESLEYTAYRLFKQDYAVEEIMKFTYLSKETVEDAIKKFS